MENSSVNNFDDFNNIYSPEITLYTISVPIHISNNNIDLNLIYPRRSNFSSIVMRQLVLDLIHDIRNENNNRLTNDEYLNITLKNTDNLECSICYENKTNNVKLIKCNHIFCELCIKKWLLNNITCPICRVKLKD